MIKAIETRYKGYRFRSRLEARWAVFFDALGLRWEYEPEGFELPNGRRYLPDFFVHWGPKPHPAHPDGAGYWVEVKGAEPAPDELEKLRLLCVESRHHGYLLAGTPGKNGMWSISARSGRVSERWHPETVYLAAFMCCGPKGDLKRHLVEFAFDEARAARFEHGECGA